jgi:hypothetical protein
MSNYRTDREAREQEAIQAQTEALSARAWFQFLEAHREIVPCEANLQIVKSYFGDEPLSLEALEESCLQNPNLRKQMVFQTTAEDRTEVLQKLKTLTGSLSPEMAYQPTEQIRSKVEEIQRRKEMENKSPEELRQIINDNRRAPEALPPLPADITRTVLLKMPPAELKATLRRFGNSAVNARLAGQG